MEIVGNRPRTCDSRPVTVGAAGRVTIADVARVAGVGKSTVARALGNGMSVARATRERVLAVAERLGYEPDPLVSKLARDHWNKRSGGIPMAFVFRLRTHRFASRVFEGLAAGSAATGLKLNVFDVSEYASPGRLQRALEARGIVALCLGAIEGGECGLDIDWSRYACVACDSSEFEPRCDWVAHDDTDAMRLACEEVYRRGYRRPALAILRNVETPDHWHFEAAYLKATEAWFGGWRVPVYRGWFDDARGFVGWYRKTKPDAVISSNSVGYWWIKESGGVMPGFVSLAVDPGTIYTGTLWDTAALAERAVLHLDGLVRRGVRGLPKKPFVIRLKPVWAEGETLPVRGG